MIVLRLQFLRLVIWMMKFEIAFSKGRDPMDIAAMKMDLLDRESDLIRAEINV